MIEQKGYSQVAALILTIRDPAMLSTVKKKKMYGNIFYIVKIAKLAWLLLVGPLAFLKIQDGFHGF